MMQPTALLSSMRSRLTAGLSRRGAISVGRPKKHKSLKKSKYSVSLAPRTISILRTLGESEKRGLSEAIDNVVEAYAESVGYKSHKNTTKIVDDRTRNT